MYKNNDIDYLKYLKRKDVYIFGGGYRGKKCAARLKKNDIFIKAFIDNNEDVSIDGYEVYSFWEFMERNHENVMIIICSAGEREIKQQLLEENVFCFLSESQLDFGGGVEYYDDAYFTYQQKMGEFGGRIKANIFRPYVSPDAILVEFGCGGGYLLEQLQAKEKVGIEINAVARANAKKLGIESVREAKELPDNFADIIISTSVLEHVENPFGVLCELRKKLKDGGKIIFHVPNESCETEYTRSEVNNHLYTWNCLNIGNLFKAAGYFVQTVERLQTVWPKHYFEIEKEVSKELFEEICELGGRAYDENSCLIVAYK